MLNIYDTTEDGGRTLIAKARHAEDAAAIMVMGSGRVVTWDGRIVLDGRKHADYALAANSYDAASDLMVQRRARHQQERRVKNERRLNAYLAHVIRAFGSD